MAKSFGVATTVLEKSVAGKKLKIKILSKKPANEVGCMSEQVGEVHCAERLSLTDDRMLNTAVNRKIYPDMVKKPVNGEFTVLKSNCMDKSFLFDNQMKSARENENKKTLIGKKRVSEGLLDCREGKRLKMDCIAASRCQSILLKLMKHKFAKPFLDPVNPVQWGINDYFDIIKHPMDLGTIKQKLHRNTYINPEEFEADVRLTFSNAMLYNPSNNWVHQHAKRLSEVFDSDWKSVKAILFRDQKNIMKNRAEKGVDKIASDGKGKCLEDNSSNVDPVPRSAMSRKENACEDLKRPSLKVRDLHGVKDHEARSSKQLRSNPDYAAPVFRRDKQSACPMSAKTTHGNTNEVKTMSAKTTHGNTNEFRTMSAKTHGNTNEVKVPNELKAVEVINTNTNTSTVQMTRSDPESEGAASCLDEEHAGASIPTTSGSFASATQSLENVLDMELSPSKALRAAKLRSRFADTIFKAQNKTLLQPLHCLYQGCIKDPAILEQEKERLVKKQHEERAKIEAQVREADLAARLKAEDELKKQRQQAREAARAALEKMERSINLDDNFHLVRDLEALIGQVWNQIGNKELRSPLERLGLYIKAEYRIGDDDDEVLLPETDLEEGEVPS